MKQLSLSTDLPPEIHSLPSGSGEKRALESAKFPFEYLSIIAEAESWRKDINRPPYHIHKWWAQRLGSVFRGIILGAYLDASEDVLEAFYKPVRLLDYKIFDPFMGSGTTVGEAVKLGANAVGRDINPVAYFLVRNALSSHDRPAIQEHFASLETDLRDTLNTYYRAYDRDGNQVTALYYFWVKVLTCVSCGSDIDLFSKYIFSQHAYKKKHPRAQSLCPKCGEVNACRYDAQAVICMRCECIYDPQNGPAKGRIAKCSCCNAEFKISDAVKLTDKPPRHRMYAKMVLNEDGKKSYLPIDDWDRQLYSKARSDLSKESLPYPSGTIEPGYNTNQVLGYNYTSWDQMFNDRQLLCLGLVARRIKNINDPKIRNLFVCLFSGVLEFNNMFASFKGEGTGAVRHMFSHHILKPERTPLEANVWGTNKSSGSFSTMFRGRIRRALDYSEAPFELKKRPDGKNEKVFGLSQPMGSNIVSTAAELGTAKSVYLSCGSSASIDLDTGSIDAVVTDPPFFDNVHYSELADFFYAWQRSLNPMEEQNLSVTTRVEGEVQDRDVKAFTEKLGEVWFECHRVLKDDGILVFSYHHSRSEGWSSVLEAIMAADFVISAVQPIKAEMSVAMPKKQAKEPIDLDIIIVCRKRSKWKFSPSENLRAEVFSCSEEQTQRFTHTQRKLSRNDVRVIVMSQLIMRLSWCPTYLEAKDVLEQGEEMVEEAIKSLYPENIDNEEAA